MVGVFVKKHECARYADENLDSGDKLCYILIQLKIVNR